MTTEAENEELEKASAKGEVAAKVALTGMCTAAVTVATEGAAAPVAVPACAIFVDLAWKKILGPAIGWFKGALESAWSSMAAKSAYDWGYMEQPFNAAMAERWRNDIAMLQSLYSEQRASFGLPPRAFDADAALRLYLYKGGVVKVQDKYQHVDVRTNSPECAGPRQQQCWSDKVIRLVQTNSRAVHGGYLGRPFEALLETPGMRPWDRYSLWGINQSWDGWGEIKGYQPGWTHVFCLGVSSPGSIQFPYGYDRWPMDPAPRERQVFAAVAQRAYEVGRILPYQAAVQSLTLDLGRGMQNELKPNHQPAITVRTTDKEEGSSVLPALAVLGAGAGLAWWLWKAGYIARWMR